MNSALKLTITKLTDNVCHHKTVHWNFIDGILYSVYKLEEVQNYKSCCIVG